MPLYTYFCNNCKEDVEVLCKIEDRDRQPCPTCKLRMERGLDRPGMVWSPTRNGGYSL
jgi:putative FmdB family regulatory protein